MCDEESGQAMIFDEVDEEIQRLNDGLDDELKAALKDIENCASSQGSGSTKSLSQPDHTLKGGRYFVHLEKARKENESYSISASTGVEHRMFNFQEGYTHRAEPGANHPDNMAGKRQATDHSIPPDMDNPECTVFQCNLCPEKFHRKLYLNNHMERRHGVKYVFTERGKKFKLVRIPENINLENGEKLDPAVKLLLKSTEGRCLQDAIGVQAIEDDGEPTQAQPKEVNPHELLNEGKAGVDYNCGFMIDKVDNAAVKVAEERGELPFAAFCPHNTTEKYLLRFCEFKHGKQVAYPARLADVMKCKLKTPEPEKPVESKEKSPVPGPSTEPSKSIQDFETQLLNDSNSEDTFMKQLANIKKEKDDFPPTNNKNDQNSQGIKAEPTPSTKRDYIVPIVAIVKQHFDEDLQQCVVRVDPPHTVKIDNISIMSPGKFSAIAAVDQEVLMLSEAAKQQAAAEAAAAAEKAKQAEKSASIEKIDQNEINKTPTQKPITPKAPKLKRKSGKAPVRRAIFSPMPYKNKKSKDTVHVPLCTPPEQNELDTSMPDIKPDLNLSKRLEEAESKSSEDVAQSKKKQRKPRRPRKKPQLSPEDEALAQKRAKEEAKDPSYDPKRRSTSPGGIGITLTPASTSRKGKRGRPRKLKLEPEPEAEVDEEPEVQQQPKKRGAKRKNPPGRKPASKAAKKPRRTRRRRASSVSSATTTIIP